MSKGFCPVCNSVMHAGLQSWHRVCPKCGYESAGLKSAINEQVLHEKIDEQSRESGLRSLRLRNFNQLMKAIENNGCRFGKLLDVGCAHGWFLEVAQKKGFYVLGIEPDVNVYNATSQRGVPIRNGFFPEVLSTNELFDVIVFNDVIEHIPDIKVVLEGCRKHLAVGGFLVLNLPSSSGFFYRLARILSRLGFNSFFDRLWQKGLPSPHLHYFNSQNLRDLLHDNGFEEVGSGHLSTLGYEGLLTRISYTGNHSLPVHLLIYLVVLLIVPLLRLMPSDIIYSVSQKK